MTGRLTARDLHGLIHYMATSTRRERKEEATYLRIQMCLIAATMEREREREKGVVRRGKGRMEEEGRLSRICAGACD